MALLIWRGLQCCAKEDPAETETDNIRIEIWDITGRVLVHKELSGLNHYLTYLQVNTLESGLYFCEIETSKERFVKKFIKQ